MFLHLSRFTSIHISLITINLVLSCGFSGESRIIFASSRNGNTDIYIMAKDGANVRRLTNSNAEDINPAVSPDGGRFLYLSNIGENDTYEIMLGFFDSTQTHLQLTSDFYDEYKVGWSPDGKSITFWREVNGNHDIWVMDNNGDNQQPITSTATYDTYPEWSGSHDRIAYVSREKKTPDAFTQIYMIKSDGTENTILTDSETFKSEPTWSPDGEEIYFKEYESNNSGTYYLKSVNIKDRSVKEIVVFDQNFYGPVILQNNRSFVYYTGRANFRSDIYIYDLIAGKEIRVTNNSFADFAPNRAQE